MKIGIDIGSHSVKTAELFYERTPVPIRDKHTKTPHTVTQFYHTEGRFLVGAPSAVLDENGIQEGKIEVDIESIGQNQLVFTDDKKNDWYVESIFALLLKKASLDMTSANSGAIFCLPPDVGKQQENGFKLISGMCDVPYLKTVVAPVCSAIYHRVMSKKSILVVDWGASGLRISLLRQSNADYEMLATQKTIQASGKSWTNKLYNHILTSWKQYLGENLPSPAVMKAVAEYIKIQLSEQIVARQSIVFDNELLNIVITREEFENLVSTDLHTFEEVLGECLDIAKITIDEIDDVVLTGGSTLIPALVRHVKKTLPDVKNWHVKDPILAQALGTALLLPQTEKVATNDYPSAKVLSIGVLNPKTGKIDVLIRDTYSSGMAARNYATTVEQPNLQLTIVRFERDKPEKQEVIAKLPEIKPHGSGNKLYAEFKYFKGGNLQIEIYGLKSEPYLNQTVTGLSPECYHLFSQMEQIRNAVINGEI